MMASNVQGKLFCDDYFRLLRSGKKQNYRRPKAEVAVWVENENGKRLAV